MAQTARHMDILITPAQIAGKVEELGAQISKDYAGLCPVLVCVLKGSFMFIADLTRAITVPHTVEFLKASSYGAGTATSGHIRIHSYPFDVRARHVLIIEDIVDTGLTLQYIIRRLYGQHPESLRVCTLLDKPAARRADVPIDYRGFTIPNVFVVGYGLDLNEQYRHLPYVAVAPPA